LKSKRWAPPGWPWELELVALIFVIIAIAVPSYLEYTQVQEVEEVTPVSLVDQAKIAQQKEMMTWKELQGFFWALGRVGLYIGHLIIAGTSIDFISTPFTHLFSPLIFSMITYYRLYHLRQTSSLTLSIVSGNPIEIVLWIIGVMVITLLVARMRMARHMLNFRSVDWEIITPTLFDSTYFELLAHFQPLVYPPRQYRACADGILIMGWFYVMPLPFDTVKVIDATKGAAVTESGIYLATSAKALIHMQVVDMPEPIYISPKDHAAFLQYCAGRVASTRQTAHGVPTVKG